MERKKTPNEYFLNITQWQAEVQALRAILLATELTEEIKWGAPCYTFAGKNVCGLAAFKNYFGIWFHQGVLLADTMNVLINAQEGKTKALRQWRMTSAKEIDKAVINAYLVEAINLVKDGKYVAPTRKKPLFHPPELIKALNDDANVKSAFTRLKPRLQREFADYITEAKQQTTKQRRLDKILPMIERGEGLHDKYR